MPHVYCLRAEDRYKIGFTSRPVGTRLRQLQTGNPAALEVYAVREVQTRTEARRLERFVLQDMKQYSFEAKGEWTDAPETLVRRILVTHRFTLV